MGLLVRIFDRYNWEGNRQEPCRTMQARTYCYHNQYSWQEKFPGCKIFDRAGTDGGGVPTFEAHGNVPGAKLGPVFQEIPKHGPETWVPLLTKRP